MMAEKILPRNDEVLALVPGHGSVTWRCAADVRALLAAGYALLLQVAHPTVGAGVAEHSNYREDPWDRLVRTLDCTTALVYAEPTIAAAVGRSVRARHTTIKGVRPDGGRYHALEPAAYAWVWATLYSSIVAAHERFASPLRRDEQQQLWSEWRRLGRLLGVRERDLPATLSGYERYFDEVVHEVLEDNASVRDVIASLRKPAAPPLPRYVELAWWLGRAPLAHTIGLATAGLLPSVLRERFDLGWTLADELELRALGTISRAMTPLMPRPLREFGQVYMRWRAGEAQPETEPSRNA